MKLSSIKLEIINTAVVVSPICNYITEDNITEFKSDMMSLLDNNLLDLYVLDTSNIREIDHYGWGTLITLSGRISARNKNFCFIGLPKTLEQDFYDFRFERVFDCFNDLKEATKMYRLGFIPDKFIANI